MANLARSPLSPHRAPPLPGTVIDLLEGEDDDDVTSTGFSPRPMNAKGDGEATMPSLPEQADEFGWMLVAAIRDFRSHIEDIFADHYQSMKRAEDVYRMSQAKLAAENGHLRAQLGLNAASTLFQNIQFDATVENNLNLGAKQVLSAEEKLQRDCGKHVAEGKNDDGKLRRAMFGKEDAEWGRGRIHQAVDPQPGGGNWETFVAWVPAGAALQCAQPWKPLPSEAFISVDLEPKLVEETDEDGKMTWKVLEMWEEDKEHLNELRKLRNSGNFKSVVPMAAANSIVHRAFSLDSNGIGQSDSPPKLPFLIHPHSLKRVLWDCTSLVMVLYDMVIIPMAFFDLEENTFMKVMNWMTRMFWTFDMGMSLCTGLVLPNGTIMFDFRFIIGQYMKRWFILDSVIVFSDWIEFVMSQGGDKGLAGLSRIFRAVRVVRLLRLVRMRVVMKTVVERLQMDSLYVILKMVQLMFMMIAFAHIIACVWWGIGKGGGTHTWSEDYLGSEVSVEKRYLISLHWTLSQFSGGMEEVRPKTSMERFFVVMIWIFCFMFGAMLVSILTSSLVQAHIIGGSQARQLATLRKYLKQNSISKNLSLRVQRSAKYAISGDLRPDVVDLLGVVSEQLRLEMNFEMYSELLRCHPFFDQCISACARAVRQISHQATSSLLLDAGDIIFSKGEAPAEPKMYFFFKGSFEYTTPSGKVVLLGEKQWIAEPVLWLEWVHRGQLKVTSDSKVAKLDARRFQDIMERFREVLPTGFSPKVYANDYAQYLNNLSNSDEVTDLTGVY